MKLSDFSYQERTCLLEFSGNVLWQDGKLGPEEHAMLLEIAHWLELSPLDPTALDLSLMPPHPDSVDPARVSARLREPILTLAILAARCRPSFLKWESVQLLAELLPGTDRAATNARDLHAA